MKSSTLFALGGLAAVCGTVAIGMHAGTNECRLCRLWDTADTSIATPRASIALAGMIVEDDAKSDSAKKPVKPATETAVPTELAKKSAEEAAKDKNTANGGDAKTAPATSAEKTPMAMPEKTELAMFGGGCFWGVEASFRRVPGVIATEVGFAGGHVANPNYKQVCYTDTGHAEVVRIVFDPAKVSYDKLLDVFFKIHNPTEVNRQGPDTGTQYRTVIFTYSPEQKAAAEKKKADLDASKKFKRPIATQIVAAAEPGTPRAFARAEDYHQQYLEKRGMESCHIPLPEAEDEPAGKTGP
jgi:peptide-methionine (S)-S-oxide reductase